MPGDDDAHAWWAAYHVREMRRAAEFADRWALLGLPRPSARIAECMAWHAVAALTRTLLALGYGCDEAGDA